MDYLPLVFCLPTASLSPRQTVGDFITVLLTYMAQLQAPLNFLGMYYQSIQSTLVDAETRVYVGAIHSGTDDQRQPNASVVHAQEIQRT
jgi:ABC-type transport system involved in Fe-S cluster assembly fused permease/ATPase subunit